MTAIDFEALLAEELAKSLGSSEQKSEKENGKEVVAKTANESLEHYLSENNEKTKQNKKAKKMKLSNDYKLKSPIGSTYYIRNYITPTEESDIMEKIMDSRVKNEWVQLKRRKLLCFGEKAKQSKGNEKKKESELAMAKWCELLIDKICNDSEIFDEHHRPNHILINNYEIGEGIMAHKDGPAYYPLVCILSLHSAITILFFQKPPVVRKSEDGHSLIQLKPNPVLQVILEPRSLFIFRDDLYHHYYHMILEADNDVIFDTCVNHNLTFPTFSVGDVLPRKQKRVSITIRHFYYQDTD
ncbi:hypothetical protein RFI_33193 [Reticulomyxa filosa]|uniref:Fe2OG dioxygenase domain-containing protein n=1 Tax=Reticulomyxa filosa TaxID=46433 RepID=X6LRE2_RETFI|nr:hypothetical protein RFI_33193 [Reticulomyxa filosa]|eukprot:ETO04204.1 hypothetical protein RFI_33193 [Reticulomyxa filosa]